MWCIWLSLCLWLIFLTLSLLMRLFKISFMMILWDREATDIQLGCFGLILSFFFGEYHDPRQNFFRFFLKFLSELLCRGSVFLWFWVFNLTLDIPVCLCFRKLIVFVVVSVSSIDFYFGNEILLCLPDWLLCFEFFSLRFSSLKFPVRFFLVPEMWKSCSLWKNQSPCVRVLLS